MRLPRPVRRLLNRIHAWVIVRAAQQMEVDEFSEFMAPYGFPREYVLSVYADVRRCRFSPRRPSGHLQPPSVTQRRGWK